MYIFNKLLGINRIGNLKYKIHLKNGRYPIKVASSVVCLLSENANYCTGNFIYIAGSK